MLMKKNILLYMAAVAGLILAGCNKTGTPEVDPLAMTVKASIGDQTKVAYDGVSTTFQTGDQLAVWAWTGASDVLPQTFVVDGTMNTLDESGKWVPATQMLWKNVKDEHYFLAVHPVPAMAIADLSAVPYTVDNTNYEASDLLLANELTGLKAAAKTVDLTFSHAMAKLQVNLKFRNQFGPGGPAPESVTAALVGKGTAAVNYLTKVVTPTGDEVSVEMVPIATEEGYMMSFAGIQIPQNATKIVVTIGKDSFSYTHPEPLPIVSGKVTTLGFNVGQDVITLESVSVNEWVFDEPITGGEAEPDIKVNLSELTADYVAKGGETLTGTLGVNVKISIADGATVTLNDVAINGVNDENCKWAGITCEGDATIILKGDNAVMGFYQTAPGIFIPEGKTLVIKGDGSLTASTYIADPSDIFSYGSGAGIGGGRDVSCGNIEIQGGNIVANGGMNAAGIGTGGIENENSTNCGTIKISGGSVVATSKYFGAGIGCGYSGICDSITISGGTVEATGGYAGPGIGSTVGDSSCGDIIISGGTVTATTSNASPGIGSSNKPSVCGNITISGGTVTAIGKGYSPGIGAGGDWFTGEGGRCGNITITSGVTKVTAIKGVSSDPSDLPTPNSIGAGLNATSCGTVTIGGVVGAITESPYVYPLPYPIDLSEVTSAYVGSVIASNGMVYATASKAADAGTTAVAIITYVGSVGSVDASSETYKGLALALADANGGNKAAWSSAAANCLDKQYVFAEDLTVDMSGIANTDILVSDGHNHDAASAARNYNGGTYPAGTSEWFLPSAGQWQKMITAAGSYANLVSNANLKSEYDPYWSSTEKGNGSAWTYAYGNWDFYGGTSFYVRACLAF